MFTKKWHGIPVAIVTAVLMVCLLAGSALAAYTFTGVKVDVAVDEPLQVQYKLDYVVHDTQSPSGRTDSSGWLDATGLGASIPASFSAGDAMTLYLRMNNRANSELTVSTIITDAGDVFTYSGFPQSQVIPVSDGYDFGSNTVSDEQAADWVSGGIPISIKGDAPPGDFTLIFEFERE